MKVIRRTVPYSQWIAGLWNDYEWVGYEFLGRTDIPTGVEIRDERVTKS